MKLNKLVYTAALAAMTLTSCTDWLDINQNPNSASASNLTGDGMLAGILNVTYTNRNSSDLWFASQLYTKSGSVSGTYPFLTGLLAPQNFDSFWANRYYDITNIKQVLESAEANEEKGMAGIAKVLLVQVYQELVDLYGDVPYTEGANPEFKEPAYDKAETIYADLIKTIRDAQADFAACSGNSYKGAATLSSKDIYMHGDMAKWSRYAASVELGLLMRVSNVQDVASQVAALESKVLKADEAVWNNPGYSKSANGKMNPMWYGYGKSYIDAVVNGHKYYIPSEELVSFMRETSHPLLRVYCEPRLKLGNDEGGRGEYSYFGLENEYYVGVPFGIEMPAAPDYTCAIGYGVLGGTHDTEKGPVSSVVIYPGYESAFFLAEAALRGMIPGGDAKAKEYYEAGVEGMMVTRKDALQEPQTTPGAIPAFTEAPAKIAENFLKSQNAKVNWDMMANNDEKMDAICAQKWMGWFMVNALEAWAEVRRTDLPSFLHAGNWSSVPKILARCMYPNTEQNLNPANYVKGIDPFENLIFWDKQNPTRAKSEPFQ